MRCENWGKTRAAYLGRFRSFRVGFFLVATLILGHGLVDPSLSQAQVTTNITSSGLGTKVNGSTTVGCVGGTCDITGGSRRGTNLFHSFGLFNVGTGDTANFLNDTGLTTSNIVGRVNGGQRSSIDGTIKTTDFGNANLFLINPFGWIFGAGASLDIGGSFHVSTADYLRFGDGTFFADNSPLPASGLTTNPVAFGFLGLNPPAPITVDGSFLQVPEGQTLSLVGGDVQIGVINPIDGTSSGGFLLAPGGRLEIASVASNREMALGLTDSSTTGLGTVTLNPGAFLDVSGERAGSIVVRGGRLLATGAVLFASGGNVDSSTPAIDIAIENEAVFAGGTGLATIAAGTGNAGDILINAGSLELREFANIGSLALGSGQGGAIDVNAGTVKLTEGGNISTQSFDGPAGDVNVTADSVLMSGPASSIFSDTTSGNILGTGGLLVISVKSLVLDDGARLASASSGAAVGGDLIVQGKNATHADELTVTGGARIETRTNTVQGGEILINAKSATISGAGTAILSGGSGGDLSVAPPTGDISLNVERLTVTSNAVIQGGDVFDRAGSITIQADNSIAISKGGKILSLAFADSVEDVTITAGQQLTMNGGVVQTSTSGSGDAGNISLKAGTFSMSNGSVVSATSSGTTDPIAQIPPGKAGSINIQVGDTLSMDNSTITTASAEAAGGDITITHTGSLLQLTNSQITTSVNGGLGGGGNITIGAERDSSGNVININPFDFITLNNSGIHANAFGGPGGNINIFTDLLLSSVPLATAITASSALNTPGTIDIQATVTEFSNDVSQLPDVPLQATELLRATCAARVAAGRSSSLVLAGRGGLPLEPGGLLPSPLNLGADSGISSDNHNRPGDRLTFSPSNFSTLALDNLRSPSRTGWDQFQLAKTTLGLDCSQ